MRDSEVLGRMIEMTEQGKWCRNSRFRDGKRCALGMLDSMVDDCYPQYISVARVLSDAMNPVTVAMLCDGQNRHDGNNYGWMSFWSKEAIETPVGYVLSNLATYNNCAVDEQEIIAWFQAAKEIAEIRELDTAAELVADERVAVAA